MNGLWRSARHMIAWFMPKSLQSAILKRFLKRRGISTDFPIDISWDIVGEPPVRLGRVEIGRNVRIGRHTYLNQGVVWSNVVIGRYCSISNNVLIAAPQHEMDHLSTHPRLLELAHRATGVSGDDAKMTLIGNDVWIAANVVIRRGVNIGDGAVVGAGSIVIDNVPPYSIVAGAPAKIIRYRFREETIHRLLQLKWWNLDEETLMKLPIHDVEKCINILESYHIR